MYENKDTHDPASPYYMGNDLQCEHCNEMFAKKYITKIDGIMLCEECAELYLWYK